ncbi:hypothetical protein PENANT_c054G10835 [Penicillium antarcticum]|uniref:Uncharacterized protein n=1 Tax=Penicillium antarcticum TaxID=416450 RepID=A0A1V6PQR5_9EURO|nr:hypothetical protein PENANT_c054G10835 [Penicillium antarcticum]
MGSHDSLAGLQGGLRSHYTGLGPLDGFLKACNVFFWPIFHGTSPALSLYAIAFAGSMIPMWLILFMHTCAKSSIVEIVMINALAGLLVQGTGPGLMMCVLLATRNTSMKAFAISDEVAHSNCSGTLTPLPLRVPSLATLAFF